MIKPLDWLVLLLASALVFATAWLLWISPGFPLQLQVRSPGGSQVYDLTRNQTVTVNGSLGQSVIQIENGKARFVSSPCNNKQCVIAGWQEHVHDVAACLPNGISIALLGRSKAFDSINF